MVFNLIQSVGLNTSIDVYVSFNVDYLLHLRQTVRVDYTHPVFPQNFKLLQIFTAFLQKQEKKNLTVYINYAAMDRPLEPRHLSQLIHNPQILQNRTLVLVLMHRLSYYHHDPLLETS